MITTLLCVLITIVGIVLYYIANHKRYNIFVDFLGQIIIVVGVITAIICVSIIIISHAGTKAKIGTSKIEYDGLVKQVEMLGSEYEDVSKTEVINRVSDWNKMVYSEKYWSNNLWTNWFYNEKYSESLNYIYTLED